MSLSLLDIVGHVLYGFERSDKYSVENLAQARFEAAKCEHMTEKVEAIDEVTAIHVDNKCLLMFDSPCSTSPPQELQCLMEHCLCSLIGEV